MLSALKRNKKDVLLTKLHQHLCSLSVRLTPWSKMFKPNGHFFLKWQNKYWQSSQKYQDIKIVHKADNKCTQI